jgi:hypothetical protein
MGKVLKVPIHLDAIVIEPAARPAPIKKAKPTFDKGGDFAYRKSPLFDRTGMFERIDLAALNVQIKSAADLLRERLLAKSWAPAILTGDPEGVFHTGEPLEAGVHLHWALPDGLSRGVQSQDGERAEFVAVPDVWLVVRFMPVSAGGSKRRLKIWAVDSITGKHQLLQSGKPKGKIGDGFEKPSIGKGDKIFPNVDLLSSLSTWVAKVRAAQGERAGIRLTAAGFQSTSTGQFPKPADDQPAPGPAWAAYYPNARERFGFHDDLADLEAGEGPVSYSVIGWYFDADDDPLHAAGSSAARAEFIEACNWKHEQIKVSQFGGMQKRGSPVIDLIGEIERLDQFIGDLTMDELLHEAKRPDPRFPSIGELPDDGPVIAGLPGGGVIDPTELRIRQPDAVMLGERTLSQMTEIAMPELEGGGKRLREDVVRKNQAPKMLGLSDNLLEQRRALAEQARLRQAAQLQAGLRPTRIPSTKIPSVEPTKPAITVEPIADKPIAESPIQPITESLIPNKPVARKPSAERLIPELKPKPKPELSLTGADHRLLASGLGRVVSRAAARNSPLLMAAGPASQQVLERVADLNLWIEKLAPSKYGTIYPGLIWATLIPDRIVCHGAVVGVPVRGTEGLYPGATDGLWPGGAQARLGSSFERLVADQFMNDAELRPLRPVLEAVQSGLVDRFSDIHKLEAVPHLLHQDSFDAYTDGKPRKRVVLLEPAAGVSLAKLDDRLPGKPITHQQLQAIANQIDSVEHVEVDLSADQVRPDLRWKDERTVAQATVMLKASASVQARLIEEPAPRWWGPGSPVVLVQGSKNSFRHGYDGRFDPDGQLSCRIKPAVFGHGLLNFLPDAGDTPVHGEDVILHGSFLAGIESELQPIVRELLDELALLDPSNASLLAKAWLAKPNQALGADQLDFVTTAFQHHTGVWRGEYLEGTKSSDWQDLYDFHGALPSIIAIKISEETWAPLMAEWQVRFRNAHDIDKPLTQRWSLGDVEHVPLGDTVRGNQREELVLTGRAYPTAVPADSLGSAIKSTVAGGDAGLVALADQLARELESYDVMGFSIPGLAEALAQAGKRCMAGTLELLRVRLVDTFGQVHEVSDLSTTIADQHQGNQLLIRPRIPAQARLGLRFMEAVPRQGQPRREARPWLGPVCGYLLPDHVEHAMEVFDAEGQALGQIEHREVGSLELVWKPAPGSEGYFGDWGTSIHDPTLRSIVQGLLGFNARIDELEAALTGQQRESALSAMIRVIDTVQDTVDRQLGKGEFISTLIGRPVAVVRARAELQIRDLPGRTEPVPLGVEARLGALTQTSDGLFGYFIDGKWNQFHPPHDEARKQARIGGPKKGLLDPTGTQVIASVTHPYVGHYQSGYAKPVAAEPSDFVGPDPTIDLVVGQPVDLVLLMDPQASIHATTGVLPRKQLALERTHFESALTQIAPTFKVGPVLVDPLRPAIPVPGLESFEWMWTRREKPPSGDDGWSETRVKHLPDEAVLPTNPMQLHEGWLRLKHTSS